MIRCLFCKRRLTTALCPNCGALEMAVWDPAADDDERARRGDETELERLLKRSIERAKEMRHAK